MCCCERTVVSARRVISLLGVGAAETMLAAVIRARGRRCLFMGCSLWRVGWEAV